MDICQCPTCGASLPAGGILIDQDSGLIVARGRFVQLTRNEFAVFSALWAAAGRVVSKEALMDELYALFSEDEEPSIKIIDVFICKLRKKLTGLPFNLETVWGSGYRVLPHAEVKEAS